MTAPGEGEPRRSVVIANPTKVDDRFRRLVAREAARQGWPEPEWFETRPDDAGQAATQAALAHGADLVLAAGGDGTLRAVAEVLRGTGIPMAPIPLGTGNLFAHNLDPAAVGVTPVVITTAQAVRTAFTGADRSVDIGVIELQRPDGGREEHAFIVAAGIGIDAQMLSHTRPESKERMGVLAYVGGIARALRSGRRIRVLSRVDDGPIRSRTAHSVLVGNCGVLPGNIPLLPDAQLDDGVFDIVTLRPEGFLGWVQVWIGVFWENGVLRRSSVGRKLVDSRRRRVRALRYEQGARISVRLEDPDEIELDGDHFGVVSGFTAEIDPGGLLVRVPDGQLRLPVIAPTTPVRRRRSRAASRAPR